MRTKNYCFVLYGIAGADKNYQALQYWCIDKNQLYTLVAINESLERLKKNPCLEKIYLIDNRSGLRYDFNQSLRKPTIENCAVFKDILERDGVFVVFTPKRQLIL